MKINHFKFNPDNKEKRTRHNFLEELVIRYFERKEEKDEDLSAPENEFEHDKVYQKVLDAIQRKHYRNILLRRSLSVAASVMLLISLITGVYYYHSGSLLNPVTMLEKHVQKGQTVFVKLADGTKIWLNSGSVLTYPDHFDGEKREVSLIGEAYFEVVHMDKKPFIIQSGEVKTVVLGTSFNIRAYPENQKVEVTVITGKVAVITPKRNRENTKTVYLVSNQKVTYNREERELMPYSNVKATESIGWREGKLIYRGNELKQVIEDVERKYNIKIKYSKGVSNCTITADFDNEGLDKVLKVMAKLVEGKVSYSNGSYFLDGNGCE